MVTTCLGIHYFISIFFNWWLLISFLPKYNRLISVGYTPPVFRKSFKRPLTVIPRVHVNYLNTIRQEKPTDVTVSILFIYRRISTCFGTTGPSSGDITYLFTQPLVQFLFRLGRVLCMLRATKTGQKVNQWLCEQLRDIS
jgi:hypothetical protein